MKQGRFMKKTKSMAVGLIITVFTAVLYVSCGKPVPKDQSAALIRETSAETPPATPAAGVLTDIEKATATLLAAAGLADFENLNILVSEAEQDGLFDGLVATLEKQATGTDAPPSVHIALSVLYGRKGLKTKEYAALVAAEAAARQPNVIFNIALVHGRKKLLEGSPDADSFMVGNLSVETDPPGAALTLDGKPAGTTPVKLESLKAGPHRIELALDGYEPVSLSSEIGVGRDALITRALVSSGLAGKKNQIENDGFEYDLQEENGQWWELYCDEPKGNYGFARFDAGDFVQGRQSLKITVSRLNGVSHEPHLKIIGLNVEKGKKYTYSVFMKADRPCRVVFDIRRFRSEIFYGNSPELSLGLEWKEYSYTVTAPESNSGDVMVLIQMGMDTANVWLDNARFYEGVYRKDDDR